MKTKNLVLLAVYVALAVGLDIVKTFLPFLNMPSGGSINIALIPLVVCSFHLGVKKGLVAGALWFVVSSIIGLNEYFIGVGQTICDYIVPSTIVGLASIFYKKRSFIEMEIGIVTMMIIRTFSIVFSGAVYWYDGSLASWGASCIYNLPYSIATMIMLMIITPIITKSLKNYMK